MRAIDRIRSVTARAGRGARISVWLALSLSIAGLACGSPEAAAGESGPLQDAPQEQRSALTVGVLTRADSPPEAPIHNQFMVATGGSSRALHGLEGRLSITESPMQASAAVSDLGDPGQASFPGFSLDFFTQGDHLVPVNREIVRSTGDRSYWSLIFSPGRTWSEPGDGSWSRASVPFVLVGDEYNQAHNGILTFVFDDSEVSSAYFQVTQETALWSQVDFWGLLPVEYAPHELGGRDSLLTAYAEELEQATPVRPWSELEDRYQVGTISEFSPGMEPVRVSTAGLIVDGVIYLQPCLTRHGEFPYCEQMRHGVFSVTKSFGAALTMLRLAEKYGEDVFDLRIADYVTINASHDGWKDVTFGDALSMTTGVGEHIPQRAEPNVMHGDEDEAKFFTFLQAPGRADKLAACFTYADYSWGPGEVARYNSCNTFLLSAALDSMVRGREGPTADAWAMVVEEVLRPVGIRHAPIMRSVEPDGSQGIPIFGYGLYLTPDDVARLSRLFLDGGVHGGRQLLHAGKVAEALFRTSEVGLPTGERNDDGAFTYHMSFNGIPYRTPDGKVWRVPFGTGYGGNHVVLIPNGVTVFRFADSGVYGIQSMIEAARAVRPFP